jgi:hypothetical protein
MRKSNEQALSFIINWNEAEPGVSGENAWSFAVPVHKILAKSKQTDNPPTDLGILSITGGSGERLRIC